MKTVISIVALCLALCGVTTAQEPNEPVIPELSGLTFSVLTEADASSTLQIQAGWLLPNGFEPGIGVRYLTGDPEWGPAPDVVLAYMGYHVKEIVLVRDDLPDTFLEQILHGLQARPYAQIGVAVPARGEERKVKLEYALGSIFSTDSKARAAFCVQYTVGSLVSEKDQAIFIGGRILF